MNQKIGNKDKLNIKLVKRSELLSRWSVILATKGSYTNLLENTAIFPQLFFMIEEREEFKLGISKGRSTLLRQ